MKIFNKLIIIVILLILLFVAISIQRPETDSQNTDQDVANEMNTETDTSNVDETDTSSESETEDNQISSETESLIGTWVSLDDSNFTRTFNADGIVVDAYEGIDDAADTGSWSVSTENPPELANINIVYGIFITMQFDSVDEPMHFPVLTLTESNLEIINASGAGNLLRFEKVVE